MRTQWLEFIFRGKLIHEIKTENIGGTAAEPIFGRTVEVPVGER
jgi:hypothetical protein